MIQPISFAEEHIRELQKTSKRDPVLLERAVYAFGLLEALACVGMPFIFKGGTCLMLLMNRPRRLSTDIDIIVEPETNCQGLFNQIHKKGARSTVWLLTPRLTDYIFPFSRSLQRYA